MAALSTMDLPFDGFHYFSSHIISLLLHIMPALLGFVSTLAFSFHTMRKLLTLALEPLDPRIARFQLTLHLLNRSLHVSRLRCQSLHHRPSALALSWCSGFCALRSLLPNVPLRLRLGVK